MLPLSAMHRSRRSFLGLLLASAASPVAAQTAPAQPADVVFLNGRFRTLDAGRPQATAAAVRAGRFLAVGSNEDVLRHAGPRTDRIDLAGRAVVPGLVDAHTHPMETIYLKEEWVDARFPGTNSVAQALDHIAARASRTPAGAWLFVACVSASENKFAEKRLPTRAELDRAAPAQAVVLANGTHMAVANSVALGKLGVTKGMTRLPNGGGIILDAGGEPTGVLTDAQGDIPAFPSPAEMERYYTSGIQALWNRFGFTSVLAITPSVALPVLKRVAAGPGQPSLRYTVSAWSSANAENMPEDLSAFEMPGTADPSYYRFAGIKDWVDGENDCRTGYMYENYLGHFESDPPGGRGTLVTPPATIDRFLGIAARSNKFAMLHCSGDAATDIALDAIERVARDPSAVPRYRIEHFGMFQLDDRQLARATALRPRGLAVSVQPSWLLGLARANVENMGRKLALTGFRFRSMIDAGLEPAAGTDMTGIYLENIDPMRAIYACVTRASDAGTFAPDQAISVQDALKMWTLWAAKAMGEEAVKGSIEVGKFADLAVLSDDPFAIPAERLKDIHVVKTIVGGRVVYDRSS